MSHLQTSDLVSAEHGIFGLMSTEETAKVVLLPVPWEVTTSYGRGTSLGPQIIRQASEQVDLFDIETGNAYQKGYFMKEISKTLLEQSKKMKAKAQEVMKIRSSMSENTAKTEKLVSEVNQACNEMVTWVNQESKKILDAEKVLGLIGGDHSTPLGAIQAVGEKYAGEFGILHIDAHADLRSAYQGFTHSHASIMYNVMTDKRKPKKLVQVGIRDFCEEEYDFIHHHPNHIKTFFDQNLKKRMLRGESWDHIARDIINELPENVYVSFDIDGLDPALCPHTGTPVPGGLSLDQVFYLFSVLADSGKRIVGFDLNEVSPGEDGASEWDGNVGARVLYKLCGWSILTNKL